MEENETRIGKEGTNGSEDSRSTMEPPQQAPLEERRRAWLELCADFERSGLSISRYSSERGCSESQLRYWLSKLGKGPKVVAKPRGIEPAGEFVELQLPQMPKPARYKITFPNGTALELGSDFQVSAVSELIGILKC